MLATLILILILVASLVGIGYGIRGISRELDGMDGAKRRGAEDAERDAEMKKALGKWREGR